MTATNRCHPTSAAGIISLLHDESYQLQEFAIKRLYNIVDEFWFEIADSIPIVEMYSESETFSERKLASILASKLHYHLGSYERALQYALGAGELLFTCRDVQFLNMMINRCIEYYKRLRQMEGNCEDPRVDFIVNIVFDKCLERGQHHDAIGLALETRRMDVLEKAILSCEDPSSTLDKTFDITLSLFSNNGSQKSILKCLADLYRRLWKPDMIKFCKCLIYLEDEISIIAIMELLMKGSDDEMLLAYQIGFGLYENCSQDLLHKIKTGLRKIMACHDLGGATFQHRMKNLGSVLSGDVTTELYLHFLAQNSHTDYIILDNARSVCNDVVCDIAITLANSLMNFGTASDRFVVDNADWWCQQNNWAEFSAVATLGIINKGREENSVGTILSYFPKELLLERKYAEAGSLYGLGLIHAVHGEKIIDYLIGKLESVTNPEAIHGCSLGIGLAALGTNREDIYGPLRSKLYMNEAVIGEAVGIAIGLIAMGSKMNDVIKEMTEFAHDTSHEKIIRGLAVGIALIMFQSLERCESVVSILGNDINPFLRCAAMHTLAMAYCGSGDNKVVQRLLSIAASDPCNDVRRAAVQAIGFIYLKDPSRCVSAISILTDSYNFEVRYAAAIALGISCCGSGNEEALSLLWGLADDEESLVIQGALIASSMILVQHTSYTSPRVNDFLTLYQETIDDKLENEMAMFGAILAQGIVNAGGRNVTISLKTRCGKINAGAVAGMLVFTQYWYWFPLVHFLSLTFLPTCLIGVNANLQMPIMEFTSNAKPSTFGYPPPTKRRKTSGDGGIITLILSFAERMKAGKIHEIHIEGEEEEEDEEDEDETGEESENKNETEADFETLCNPSRVTLSQMKFLQIPEGSRYEAVKDITEGGIIVMRDREKGEPEELVKPTKFCVDDEDDEEMALYFKPLDSEGDSDD